MLYRNGKKAGYSQIYDDPDSLIDAASHGKIKMAIAAARSFNKTQHFAMLLKWV